MGAGVEALADRAAADEPVGPQPAARHGSTVPAGGNGPGQGGHLSDRLALAKALEDAGIERGNAERVASVIIAVIATKADVQASEAALRAAVATLRGEVRSDLARTDAGIERMGGRIVTMEQRLLVRLGGVAVALTGIALGAMYVVLQYMLDF